MQLILGGINGKYLREITEKSRADTESVKAAVAYASESALLFDWCWTNRIPLQFWGRFDESVPITPDILRTFLERRSPNFICKLVKYLHAKVIWWRGVGAYIGSANLSNSAWYNNIEAGCFFRDDELYSTGQDVELEAFFQSVDKYSSPLSEELLTAIQFRFRQLNELNSRDKDAKTFSNHHGIVHWPGLVQVTPQAALDRRKEIFLKEWHQTLQILRNIAALVSVESNRPRWIGKEVPAGAQADQFLHAHYYHRTFEGRKAVYETHYAENRKDPEKAQMAAIKWWHGLATAPSEEDKRLNEWAPLLRERLSSANLMSLSESDLVDICLSVRPGTLRVG